MSEEATNQDYRDRLNTVWDNSLGNGKSIAHIFKRLEAIELEHRKLDELVTEISQNIFGRLESLELTAVGHKEDEERSISNSAEIREIITRLDILEHNVKTIERPLTVSDHEVLAALRIYYDSTQLSMSDNGGGFLDMRKTLEQFLKDRP